MSSRRSRSGGSRTGTTRSRNQRSSRNFPAFTCAARSSLVAATMRTSAWRGLRLPTGMYSPSCSTRSSLGWSASGRSPISSRKSVPPSASAKKPSRACSAPVKAPFSWPKSSASARFSGMALMLSAT